MKLPEEQVPGRDEGTTVRRAAKKKRGKMRANNYCLEGMSLGMCFGLLAGTMLEGYIGAALSIGMIAGLVVGMLIPKKAEGGEQ